MVEEVIRPAKTALSVRFDTVSIEFECTSEYEAQVLFDDLAERLKSGQRILISPTGPVRDD